MSPLAAEIFEVRNCFRCLIPLMHFYMLPLPIFIHKTVKGCFFITFHTRWCPLLVCCGITTLQTTSYNTQTNFSLRQNQGQLQLYLQLF